jgi:hypothetical protein
MELADAGACHVKATTHEGATCLPAQSMELTGATRKATIAVEGLKAGAKIEVVDEGRLITAGDGAFADDFAPLQEHVYRIPKD